MAMSDEDREQRAQERALRARSVKMQKVWNALSKSKRKTLRQLADETGYSKKTVSEAIKFLRQETEVAVGDFRTGSAITMDPRNHTYWIARNWPEEWLLIEWLRKHLTTRARHLNRFLDVPVAMWPGDVPINIIVAMQQLDDAIRRLEEAAVHYEPGRPHHNRGVNLHG